LFSFVINKKEDIATQAMGTYLTMEYQFAMERVTNRETALE
jgi:hypothetical protein